MKTGTLILVRHGQSTYNARGIWAGFTDCGLTDRGRQEARQAARAVRDQKIDVVYVTDLKRSVQTWQEMAKVLKCSSLKPVVAPEFKERDYGKLAGHSKWKLFARHGLKMWLHWRRNWDYPVPGGETLKDVYHRAVPYFRRFVLPQLEDGKTVLISAHGNSLRALVKYLDRISDSDIAQLEIATGGIYLYTISSDGTILREQRRAATNNQS